jgi:TonB family protein
MRGTGKNKKGKLSGFLRYSGNKMTNRERNAFERELQKDSFADEAAEGFSGIEPEEVEEDLSILQKRLERRIVHRHRFIYYRLAASVAILMVITSIFIIMERNRSSKLINENLNNRVAIAIPESTPLYKPAGKDGVSEKQSTPVEKTKDNPITGQTGKEPENAEVKPEKAKSESLTKADNTRSLDIKAAERNIVSDQPALPAAAMSTEEVTARNQIRGKVVSSEDNQPIPGANIMIKGTSIGTTTDAGGNFKLTLPDASRRSLVANFIGMESKEFQAKGDSIVKVSMDPSILALDEVVVVGYGAKRSKDISAAGAVSKIDLENKVSESEYNPPEPETGQENFDKYIEDNLRHPDILKKGERAVVVVSFVVQTNGIIDSVKIIRSPGRPFSEEAIRLIKQGPAWKPAQDNGKAISDEVRVRIVFK